MDQIAHYYFNFAQLEPYWPQIRAGFVLTLQMSALVVVLGIALGLALALVRIYGMRPVNVLIVAYCDVMRALPPLVVIVLFYFALPYVGPAFSAPTATVLALTLVLAAFAEEIFWAGLTTVRRGQWEAGRSTGLSFTQTLFSIVLPQALRMSIPPLTNRAIATSKATTLGSVISASDLLNVTSSIQANLANPSALTLGAILFVLVFLPFVWLTRALETRMSRGRRT